MFFNCRMHQKIRIYIKVWSRLSVSLTSWDCVSLIILTIPEAMDQSKAGLYGLNVTITNQQQRPSQESHRHSSEWLMQFPFPFFWQIWGITVWLREGDMNLSVKWYWASAIRFFTSSRRVFWLSRCGFRRHLRSFYVSLYFQRTCFK